MESFSSSESMWFGVTRHPTAERIARQLIEAYAWQPMPKYVLRDRDRSYGGGKIRMLKD